MIDSAKPPTLTRRFWLVLASLGAAALLAACAAPGPSLAERPPIVFVHGNGDTAALWTTTIWRFESNGWPRARLYAIDLPYPLARDDDTKPQDGRTSTDDHMRFLAAEVDKVRAARGLRLPNGLHLPAAGDLEQQGDPTT